MTVEVASKKKAKGLSSITNAIHLLKIFNKDDYEMGISDMAKKLQLAKSTVYRMASTLASEGLLEKNASNDKYRLGITLFSFGTLVRRRMNVSSVGRPFLMDLRSRVNETVLLGIPVHHDIMCINHFESNQTVHIRTDIGVKKNMVCTAEGLIYLASQPLEFIDEVLSKKPMPRTTFTETDVGKIRQRIDQARQQGYAVDDQESEVGMCSVSAPVRNSEGLIDACISVAGPTQRMTEDALDKIIPAVIETSRIISHRLGYQESSQ